MTFEDDMFAGGLEEIAHDLGPILDKVGQLLEVKRGDEMLMENRRQLELVQLAASWQAEQLRTQAEAA